MAKLDFSKRKPIFDHFDELRVRLMRCIWVFFGGFLLSLWVTNAWVMDFLREPLMEVLPDGAKNLYFTGLFENFMTHLKVAAISSVFLLSPYYFYELWQFISPGLEERERKWVVPFVLLATLFFVGGASFAYFGLFPVAFQFFVEFGLPSDSALFTIGSYYSTVLKLLLLFGLAFELPVLILLLGVLGLVTPGMLRKNRRYAFIGITIFCGMFAPPDAISMIMMMIPLYAMYEIMISVLGWLGIKDPEPIEPVDEDEETPVSPGLVRNSTKIVEESDESVSRQP